MVDLIYDASGTPRHDVRDLLSENSGELNGRVKLFQDKFALCSGIYSIIHTYLKDIFYTSPKHQALCETKGFFRETEVKIC